MKNKDGKFDFEAYTDGSCNNLSPYGEGGSAYIVLKDGVIIKEGRKGFINTTNNRMELLAIISAVNAVPKNHSLLIHTDSQYCITVLTSKKKQKKNTDLIALFHEASSRLSKVEFEWVRGHDGNEYNELVDSMAYQSYEEIIEKYNLPVKGNRK